MGNAAPSLTSSDNREYGEGNANSSTQDVHSPSINLEELNSEELNSEADNIQSSITAKFNALVDTEKMTVLGEDTIENAIAFPTHEVVITKNTKTETETDGNDREEHANTVADGGSLIQRKQPGGNLLTINPALQHPDAPVLIFFMIIISIWNAYLKLLKQSAPEKSLSIYQLARRLNVSRKMLHKHKKDLDFPDMSQQHDPDSLRWNYVGGVFVSNVDDSPPKNTNYQ